MATRDLCDRLHLRRSILFLGLAFFVLTGCTPSNSTPVQSAQRDTLPPLRFEGSALDLLQPEWTWIDRLHGFAVTLSVGWNPVVKGNALIFSNGQTFVVIRAARYEGTLHEIARRWIEELQLAGTSSLQLFQKTFAQGIAVYGAPLQFPFFLLSSAVLAPATPYQTLTFFVPGRRTVLIYTILAPLEAPRDEIDTALRIVRTLRFLPPEQRISYRTEALVDPVYGIPALWIPVPEGFLLTGQVVRADNPQFFYRLDGPGGSLRSDAISFQSYAAQSFPGVSQTASIVTWNGQSLTWPQAVLIQTPEACAPLLLSLWEMAGMPWTLRGHRVFTAANYPLLRLLARPLEDAWHSSIAMMQMTGTQVHTFIASHLLLAQSGRRTRLASFISFAFYWTQPGIMSSQSGGVTFPIVDVMEFEDEADLAELLPVFLGVLTGKKINPSWSWRVAQENLARNRIWNQAIRAYAEAAQEFETRTHLAWTNILSEQTFAKDPETGEIFQLDDVGGNFWRDPDTGAILATVPGTDFEAFLQANGWRQLPPSLEGFPEQWR